MKYQVGKVGRVVVAKFEDREDVLGNLSAIVKKEGINAAAFYLVGGMREGKIVVGPEKMKCLRPRYGKIWERAMRWWVSGLYFTKAMSRRRISMVHLVKKIW